MNNLQLKQLQIPILVIGTKADLVDDAQRLKQSQRAGNVGMHCFIFQFLYDTARQYFSVLYCLADQCQADEICMNSHDPRSLAAGTTDAVKLARFFDKVIERKFYARGENSTFYGGSGSISGIGTSGIGAGLLADKQRRTTPFQSPFTTPFTSPFGSPIVFGNNTMQ